MQFQKSRKRQQKVDRLAARESEKEAERRAVVYTLRIQDLLTNMGDDDKDNFRTGTNGALVRGEGDVLATLHVHVSVSVHHSCCLSLSCLNWMRCMGSSPHHVRPTQGTHPLSLSLTMLTLCISCSYVDDLGRASEFIQLVIEQSGKEVLGSTCILCCSTFNHCIVY